jgi:glycosyltransferase involved in cell wall biosynthesis
MEIPVLIPARNEETVLPAALKALSDQLLSVEPIVITNGCDDATAELAFDAGATVLESAEGKMTALQTALGYLGERALNTLLVLDADSMPISKNWSMRMTSRMEAVEPGIPLVGSGLIFLRNGSDRTSDIARRVRSNLRDIKNRDKPKGMVQGANMGLRISDESMLDDILSMPNYWPGEDRAIRDTILGNGGRRVGVTHPQSVVLTELTRVPSVWRRLKIGKQAVNRNALITYLDDAPAGSVVYSGVI